MARLLHLSIVQTRTFGSTCLGMVSLFGRKLAYLNVGDVKIEVFRYNNTLLNVWTVFVSDAQH